MNNNQIDEIIHSCIKLKLKKITIYYPIKKETNKKIIKSIKNIKIHLNYELPKHDYSIK